MSLSKPRNTGVSNPAKKFIKWKGSAEPDKGGFFAYYDKESKKDIKVDLSKGFVVLDQDLFSVTGYRDRDKTMFASNEVRTIHDKITIRSYKDGKSSIDREGTYSEMKEQIKDINHLGYTKSIYIFLDGELCHLALKGKSIVEFGSVKGHEDSKLIVHNGHKEGMAGTNKFVYPLFEVGADIPESVMEKAVEVDAKILQPHLERYLGGSSAPQETHSQEAPSFDSKRWREFQAQNGKALGAMSRQEIFEIHESLVENNDTDGDFYACVGQALYDYQQAQKNWTSVEDKSKRKLSDYSLQELRDVYAKLPFNHEFKIMVEVAMDAQESASQGDDYDEDSIPF